MGLGRERDDRRNREERSREEERGMTREREEMMEKRERERGRERGGRKRRVGGKRGKEEWMGNGDEMDKELWKIERRAEEKKEGREREGKS